MAKRLKTSFKRSSNHRRKQKQNRQPKPFSIKIGKISIDGFDDRIFPIYVCFLMVLISLLIFGIFASHETASFWQTLKI